MALISKVSRGAARACAALALSAAMATSATGAPVTSYSPASVAAALQNAGYKAKLSTDKDGDTKIETADQGNDITIAFAGCDQGKSCDQVEFLAFWECSDGIKRCEALHAKWNTEEMFSKTIVTGNKIVLYKHILFDKAGISEELFIRNFVQFSGDAVSLLQKY